MSKSDNGDVVKIEEELAIVQFNGLLMDANLLKEKAASCKFFKLDEEEPIIQIGNQFYKGTLEYVMGTAMCFEETEPKNKSKSAKADAETIKKLTFLTKTDKSLSMKRVFLQPKQDEG